MEITRIENIINRHMLVLLVSSDDKSIYLYDDESRILVPLNQNFEEKNIKSYVDEKISVNFGNHSFTEQLINVCHIQGLLSKMNKISAYKKYELNKQRWIVYDNSSECLIYDANSNMHCSIKYVCNAIESGREFKVIYLHGDSFFSDNKKFEKLGLSVYKKQPAFTDENDDLGIVNTNINDIITNNENNCYKNLEQNLLDCDRIRCGLPSYDIEILNDIKSGHWDVFENPEAYSDKNFIPRDPKNDIKKNGIIGIDFGTKSTVVVKQEDRDEIRPLRIGSLSLGVEVHELEYENPTIISCLDLNSFLEQYLKKEGRPDTSCDDFFVSYNAYEEFKNCPTENFYAYYSDLKQWANLEKNNAVVQDVKNKEKFYLKNECSVEKKSINPIELYAYYIGMYINNMRNGIFMRYIMSFPVKYSKETKEIIRSSFEKGIKKSLPQSIVTDDELMKSFSLSYQISEPAAYAVTALEQYGFKPKNENEKYLYGIFDFGGGTTDFDFGVWRGASDEEYDRFNCDYVLECFGADSDDHLGGENILELLAYQVFKENKKMAAEKKIMCALPVGQIPFIGGENLISNSQSANRNLSILKEELRPLWEQHDNWKERYYPSFDNNENEKQCINVQLYNNKGISVPNCIFEIDTNKLQEIIKERIKQGVDAFFKCIEKAILCNEKAKNSSEKVYIFLAGNSCKSKFVKELFDINIEEYNRDYSKIAGDKQDRFVLIQPLSSGNFDSQYIPNAKTSVAYGLVKSRPGGKIKVIKNFETDYNSEAKFKYYLGTNRRGNFICKFSPVMEDDAGNRIPSYNKWVKIQGAGMGVARIYYTENPSADSKLETLPISDIQFCELNFEADEEKYLFIRAIKPLTVEWAIANSEQEIDNDCINELEFGD